MPGSWVRIPIDYCLGSSTSAGCNGKARPDDAKRKLPAGLHMGGTSAAALKTDIHAQVI